MNRLTSLAALAFLAACALPPSDVTKEQIAFYDAAVKSIGCELVNESDYLPVEFQTGLTREQVLAVTEYKLQLEEAQVLESGGVRLVGGPCAPDAAQPVMAELPVDAT